MEVQFGKYSFVAYDLTKLQDLFALDAIVNPDDPKRHGWLVTPAC